MATPSDPPGSTPEAGAQRAYTAPCPGCGAPVAFRSAQSSHAVCGYCQSTVVREGDKLARIGKMAELFEDFSTLQLMASGRWNNQGFTLVGRLQYKYGEGTWTEWHALFDDGGSGFLSEDNGAFVFTKPLPSQAGIPGPERFKLGGNATISGKAYTVGSNQQVALISAQGELPHLPALGVQFAMVELRSAQGEVLSIDYGATPPVLSIGSAVQLDDLKLSGLKDDSAKTETGRQFACPNCGAQVSALLVGSKSLTCSACKAIIDISQGVGGELKAAAQDEPVAPLIALGSVGQLQNSQWQVVGFQHRTGSDPNDPDETFGWSEYLLYNKKRGFTFLVDSEEGWSLVRPTTGAPVVSSNGQTAKYLNVSYQQKESYNAQTDYVLGEFYWQVQRGQTTQNRDYVGGASLLSMEQSPTELTWSSGNRIDSATVAKAFKLEDRKDLLQRSDAGPVSGSKGMSLPAIIIVLIIVLVVLSALGNCSGACDSRYENCAASSGTRSAGGSYGGSSSSSGGGHK